MGQRQVTGNAGTQPIELIFLGSQYDGDLCLDGPIAEYVFYGTALSDPQIRQVEGYLKAKYDL